MKAICIRVIETLGDVEEGENSETVMSTINDWASIALRRCTVDTRNVVDSFHRTLDIDEWRGYDTPDNDAPDIESAWQRLLAERLAADGWSPLHSRRQRFFLSSDGRMGLAPWNAQLNDVVCIPFGAHTPYVTRPNGDHYTCIGSAYVHGVMRGEMVKEYEEGKRPPVDIYLR